VTGIPSKSHRLRLESDSTSVTFMVGKRCLPGSLTRIICETETKPAVHLDNDRMSHFALSATTATGLFTLLGTISGGTLTAIVEILRRRWQREDAREASTASVQAAQVEERKVLYPQLLAKISELESIALRTLLIIEPSYRTVSSFELEDIPGGITSSAMRENLVKNWPTFAETAIAYEEIKARVLMVAGEEVRKKIEEVQKRISRKIVLACAGISVKKENDDDPSEQLIEAMRSELTELTISRGRL
jgi:hypothetical protein